MLGVDSTVNASFFHHSQTFVRLSFLPDSIVRPDRHTVSSFVQLLGAKRVPVAQCRGGIVLVPRTRIGTARGNPATFSGGREDDDASVMADAIVEANSPSEGNVTWDEVNRLVPVVACEAVDP